jgi:hypothetical protein
MAHGLRVHLQLYSWRNEKILSALDMYRNLQA